MSGDLLLLASERSAATAAAKPSPLGLRASSSGEALVGSSKPSPTSNKPSPSGRQASLSGESLMGFGSRRKSGELNGRRASPQVALLT